MFNVAAGADGMCVPVPLATIGIFVGTSLIWGWLSDGPCRGARWPFIHVGAVITVRVLGSKTWWRKFLTDRILIADHFHHPHVEDATLRKHPRPHGGVLAE
jgi:hypothetical protein